MHLFEFEDHPRTPSYLRATLLEILELCNRTFRPYYRRISGEVLALCERENLRQVVELGAGTSPITKSLASWPGAHRVTLIPCDLYPDVEAYKELQRQLPDRVEPCLESLDFAQPLTFPPKTVLVLSAAFHHIPPAARRNVVIALTQSADRVAAFEPIQKNLFSIMLTFTSLFPALLLPFLWIFRPGALRRMLWCWLIPVAPLMFVWDGVVGCLRRTSARGWQELFDAVLPDHRQPIIRSGVHSQVVIW